MPRMWIASLVAVALAACYSPPDFGDIGAAVARGIAEGLQCSGDFNGKGTLTSGGAPCPVTTSFEVATLADGGVSPPGCSPDYLASPGSPCLWTCVEASGETRTISYSV